MHGNRTRKCADDRRSLKENTCNIYLVKENIKDTYQWPSREQMGTNKAQKRYLRAHLTTDSGNKV